MSEKKFSLSGLLGFLKAKGVSVKLNEQAANEDEQFELVEEITDPDEPDPVATDPQPKPTSQFSDEEIKGIKTLLSTFAEVETEAFANALKQMPTVTSFIQNEQERVKNEKALVIERIKANSTMYTDEELQGLPVSVLNKMEASLDVNYTAMGGAQEVFSNADDSVLQPMPSLLAMAEKESE